MNSSYLYFSSKILQPLTSYHSFGFKDGVSQPAIRGVDHTNNPGQEFVDPGVTILGRVGDLDITGATPKPIQRPSWALDGSFLAFRYLFQLVPEFNTFLKQNPIAGPAPDLGSELLGARMVGRWKSGMSAPDFVVVLASHTDGEHRSTRRSDANARRPSHRKRQLPQQQFQLWLLRGRTDSR